MTTVTALYAGTLRTLEPEGQQTGIFKTAVETAEVTPQGIIGDHQADRRYHGGPDKALHQYALQSYEIITAEFPLLRAIAVPGSIGENISSTRLTDTTVCIGDIYRIGDSLVQVSQPRSPCWKINHKFDVEKLSIFIERRRITGWYYRVLEIGSIKVGDEVTLVDRLNDDISVAYFTQVTKQHRPDLDALNALIQCRDLNPEWQAKLESRHNYLENLK